MRSRTHLGLYATILAFTLAIAGCATGRTNHTASSVVQYLYPNSAVVASQAVPRLSLPLRVGIAFVPEGTHGGRQPQGESEKAELMKKIAAEFKKYPFVKSIEIIPSAYLTPAGSFTNLDQIRTMHGIDVIALLSYDQVQYTDEGLLSMTYWTLVGAYVIHGEKNDTNTMLDAAVYDIPSRKMLFRAPGTSTVKGAATPINLSEALRSDARKGFDEAAQMLVANLKEQLTLFRERVKESPQEYQIKHKPGYTGGGSMSRTSIGLLAAMGGLAVCCGRGRRD